MTANPGKIDAGLPCNKTQDLVGETLQENLWIQRELQTYSLQNLNHSRFLDLVRQVLGQRLQNHNTNTEPKGSHEHNDYSSERV